MGRIFDSTKEDTDPHTFQQAGKTIVCAHCGNVQFVKKRILLNTPGMTFFKLDWANKTATTLMCTTCSQILWFMNELERS
jgi:predicted nucleic-acid-binding Zn-ribbon protein